MSQGNDRHSPPEAADPFKAAYASYEQLESRLSQAMDEMVATNGFAEVFTTTATTTMALTKMVNGALDQAVKATRFASRQDVVTLARQMARTEEKLERLLQSVETLADEVARLSAERVESAATARSDASSEPSSEASTEAQPVTARTRAPRKSATSKSAASKSAEAKSGAGTTAP